MKTIKSITSIIACAMLALSLSAQTPVTPVEPVPDPVAPDLSMLTNHAALVGYAFKQVKGVKVSVSSGAQINNWESAGFFVITNEVKSLDLLNDTIGPVWWGLQLTDPRAYVSLNAQLWNTEDINDVYGYKKPDVYQLFYAYGGGQPIKTSYGYWTLAEESTQLQVQLASQIKIKVPGVIDARLVVQDENGNYYGMQVGIDYNGGVWFPSDYAGANSVLVLTTQIQTASGNWYSYTKAYDVRKNVEVPLTQLIVHYILRDSDDFKSFKDPQDMNVKVYSYQGHGKVPLIMPTFTSNSTNVSLSVYTTEGKYATAYSIEDQQTKQTRTITVPAGEVSIKVDFKSGVHYIIPLGIDLKPWNYWGGKG